MKTLKIIVAIIFLGSDLMAQGWEFGSDFNLAQPVGGMTKTMNNAFGMNFQVAKNLKTPIALGMDLGFASYGSQTTRQEYTFEDGSVTETNVVVTNSILNLKLGAKYFFRNNKNVNPYLNGKLGWTWFTTNLVIEDPEDETSCSPLDSDILSRDNTYLASAGAGVRFDFNTFFRNTESQRFYFDLSVNVMQGGTVRYMNVDHTPSQQTPDQDVMARFINTQTQVIHEHHVGYVYTSLVNMVEYKLGVICKPTWK